MFERACLNSHEAKKILALYQPGRTQEPEVTAALEQVERDPELKKWFADHTAFQKAVGKKFDAIPIPAGLAEKIISERKVVVSIPWWKQRKVWAVAAVLTFFLGISAVYLSPPPENTIQNFKSRMVRTVLRDYRMDVVSSNQTDIKRFLASQGAPVDFEVPEKLTSFRLTGGGVLRWQNRPVSMICFDRGDEQMLFLFVTEKPPSSKAPSEKPMLEKVSHLLTASWTQGNKTYLVAGPEDTAVLREL